MIPNKLFTRAGCVAACICAATLFVLSGCSGSAKTASDNGISVPSASYSASSHYMQAAIDEARDGIYNGDGGPFGSVIVKDGEIIGSGHNHVLSNNDSTCHGEVDAIRKTEEKLGTYDLSGCELYTTGEPCPMCLAACLWANIDKVYYGCTIEDNSVIGFRDEKFDDLMGGREKLKGYLEEVDRDACLKLFDEYKSLDAQRY